MAGSGMSVAPLVVSDVEVRGIRCDVLLRAGQVAGVGGPFPSDAGTTIDGAGGALIPGLHDHHLHLLSLAAELTSVRCGPPDVTDARRLAAVLREKAASLPPGAWIRGTGYHERIAGALDARALDRFVADRPVRVQHRGGALWMLNTMALDAVAQVLDDSPDVERDAEGRPTGRLWRYDARLRPALPPAEPDLRVVGRRLAAYGITGVTDATPALDAQAVGILRRARRRGALPQDVRLLGHPLEPGSDPHPDAGPWKIHLRDHDLPGIDRLTAEIECARRAGRAVAVHCVTRTSLLLTLAALERAGPAFGDRVEHAAVVPPGIHGWMRRLGVTVVTQPGFLAERGDDYLREVDPEDLPHLYPYASLVGAGVPVVASSDAPFGPLDPWAVMRAARDRRTRDGVVLLPRERVGAAIVLDGCLSPLEAPGGPPREIRAGAAADLVLLRGSLEDCLADPDARRVRLVLKSGAVIHDAR